MRLRTAAPSYSPDSMLHSPPRSTPEERESLQENIFGTCSGTRWKVRDRRAHAAERRAVVGIGAVTRRKGILLFHFRHPLDKFRDEMALFDRVTTPISGFRDQKVEIACVVQTRRDDFEARRRRGAHHHRGLLGTATVLAFGDTWAACKDCAEGRRVLTAAESRKGAG